MTALPFPKNVSIRISDYDCIKTKPRINKVIYGPDLSGYMQGSMGRAIKTRLGIPSPLWCSAVILKDKMRSTHHNYFGPGDSMGLRMRQKAGILIEVEIIVNIFFLIQCVVIKKVHNFTNNNFTLHPTFRSLTKCHSVPQKYSPEFEQMLHLCTLLP